MAAISGGSSVNVGFQELRLHTRRVFLLSLEACGWLSGDPRYCCCLALGTEMSRDDSESQVASGCLLNQIDILIHDIVGAQGGADILGLGFRMFSNCEFASSSQWRSTGDLSCSLPNCSGGHLSAPCPPCTPLAQLCSVFPGRTCCHHSDVCGHISPTSLGFLASGDVTSRELLCT